MPVEDALGRQPSRNPVVREHAIDYSIAVIENTLANRAARRIESGSPKISDSLAKYLTCLEVADYEEHELDEQPRNTAEIDEEQRRAMRDRADKLKSEFELTIADN